MGKVISINEEGVDAHVDSLRMKRKDPPTFVFSNIKDESTVPLSDFITPLKLISEHRGTYIFEKSDYNVL